MIPKIIHYCWLSGDPIPAKFQKCMDSWKKFLPDYEFMLWDLNRFDINQTQWVKQAFVSKKYAFAADYIRLYAVYTYGGIYLDMDVEVIRNLNELLMHPYLLGMESKESIEAGVFGATLHNEYIKMCLEYYENRSFIKVDGSYDMLPLPRIMYKVLNEHYTVKDRKAISIEESSDMVSLFPLEYLTAKSHRTGELMITHNTYTIHHFAGSWVPKSYILKKRIYQLISRNKIMFWIYKNTYGKLKKQR
uniref:glycosyltransferase family 32 protein n=1 Tax=uncultured Bacteroides sp. TaxID=162156 RepID=UPI00280B6876|nr:glycosyltransferase [uncultured Bacteroides sp.]